MGNLEEDLGVWDLFYDILVAKWMGSLQHISQLRTVQNLQAGARRCGGQTLLTIALYSYFSFGTRGALTCYLAILAILQPLHKISQIYQTIKTYNKM